MMKWLVLCSLIVNLGAFLWLSDQGAFLPDKYVSTGYWLSEQGGGIVLLSELSDISSANPVAGVRGLLAESSSTVGSGEPRVDFTERLTLTGQNLKINNAKQTLEGVVDIKNLRARKNENETLPEPEPETLIEKECVVLGFFNKKEDANSLLIALKEKTGVEGRLRAVVENVVRYLVYIPPFESQSIAKEKQMELSEAGVRSSLYYAGDLKHGLSLGYFGSHLNAERHYNNLQAAGYKVMREVVETPFDRYQIELLGHDDSKLSQFFWQDMAKAFPNVVREKGVCSTVR